MVRSAGLKIVLEPDSIENTAEQSFYACYDRTKNLWFGVELVTRDNVDWWRRRVAYDIYMHFKQDIGEQFHMMMMGPPSTVEQEARVFYNTWRSEIESNGRFMQLSPTQSRMDRSRFDNDYSNAWRGFAYNLDHYTDAPTWVAYVSSSPINGPLYLERDVDVAIPAIKMAMTVQVSQNFYCPLGIYRSPIADAYDKGDKHKNLSMSLHAFVARSMVKINPNAQYVVVRPLQSMKRIFEASGVLSSSKDQLCIEYKGGGRGWYHTPFSDFALSDPARNVSYKISDRHWFRKSDYLAGIDDQDIMDAFPFVTMRRVDLENYGLPTMRQIVQQVKADTVQRALAEAAVLE